MYTAKLIQVLDSEFQRTWIRTHAEHAKDVLHKPVCALHLHMVLHYHLQLLREPSESAKEVCLASGVNNYRFTIYCECSAAF